MTIFVFGIASCTFSLPHICHGDAPSAIIGCWSALIYARYVRVNVALLRNTCAPTLKDQDWEQRRQCGSWIIGSGAPLRLKSGLMATCAGPLHPRCNENRFPSTSMVQSTFFSKFTIKRLYSIEKLLNNAYTPLQPISRMTDAPQPNCLCDVSPILRSKPTDPLHRCACETSHRSLLP